MCFVENAANAELLNIVDREKWAHFSVFFVCIFLLIVL